jgi:hypothetical protein
MNYFLAPRSGEKSYKNFESTIVNGVPFKRIEKYLTEEGKQKITSEDIIYAWGNREGTKSQWEKMQYGDTVIFYAHRKLVMAAEVYYKQHNDGLAEAMWPLDDNGKPWAYTFFVKNLRYISIPMHAFNVIAGYKPNFIVQGFVPISDKYRVAIEKEYGSIEQLLKEFGNEQSEEIPLSDDSLYVNIDSKTKPEIVLGDNIQPREIKTQSAKRDGKPYKADYTARSKSNAIIGSKGEELVLQVEAERLLEYGRGDLADKVTRVSLEDDSKGFDILSYEKNGDERYIEVKTSNARTNSIRFFMSQNEYDAAKELQNYHIYYVDGVNDETPRVTMLEDSVDSGQFLVRTDTYVIEGVREKK